MNKIEEPKINKNKTIQMIEIGDIKWLTLDELIKKIRSYDHSKIKLIKEVDNLLNELDKLNTLENINQKSYMIG